MKFLSMQISVLDNQRDLLFKNLCLSKFIILYAEYIKKKFKTNEKLLY